MKLRGLRWQSIDMTQRCTLKCDWCGKLTHESDHEMTMEQIDNMLEHIRLDTDTIRVSGGEPLVHPQFNAIMYKLLTRFNAINVATNGTLINRILPALTVDPRMNFLVSHYDARGCDIEHIDVAPTYFYDPRHDPDLGDSAAKFAYERCAYHQIKVIGDRVYDCCHAETVERVYGGMYHSIVGENWRVELERADRWQACKHCFISEPKTYESTR